MLCLTLNGGLLGGGGTSMTVGAIIVCGLTLFGFLTWRFSGMDEFEDDGAATGEEEDV